MQLHIKALLLSGLVLPGLGQLYKGDRIKGIIIVLLVNIFLLVALFLILRTLGPTIVMANISGNPDAAGLLEQLRQKAPMARWLLASFCGLWLYSAFDAAFRPSGDNSENS